MPIIPVEIIQKKRDGFELSLEEIQSFIQGLKTESVGDEQVGAFLMACYLNPLSPKETAHLTQAMIDSGKRVQWPSTRARPLIDKHSTGGVGDKTSMIIAPIVANFGVGVPMITGRGLGHTGGTSDKLESLEGYDVSLPLERFQTLVEHLGCSIIGQTQDISPADKKLYAVRDVTATVDSIPLITASIMSKKLAASLDGLVMDIKLGSGAFMKTLKQAQDLARSLEETASCFETRFFYSITNMNQTLGYAVGNSLEIQECLEILRGEESNLYNEDLVRLSVHLSAAMLFIAEKVSSLEEGEEKARKVIQSGQAFKTFQDMAEAQGCVKDLRKGYDQIFAQAPKVFELKAERSGHLASWDPVELGMSVVELGGGRKKASDSIDHRVGLKIHKKTGDSVSANETLITVFCDENEESQRAAIRRLNKSFQIQEDPLASGDPLIFEHS
jgi:pyrimidine-nucleoside phosphorylase